MIPVLATVATDNTNIDQLYKEIHRHLEFIKANSTFASHRRQQIQKKIINILKNRFEKEFLEHLTDELDFEKIIDEIYEGKNNPFQVGKELFDKFYKR
jgi:putative protein kinase ArgK-like GTPase of G3E family